MELKDIVNKLFYEQDRDPHTTGNVNKRNYFLSELMDFDQDIVGKAVRGFYTADRFPKIGAIRQRCQILQNERNSKFRSSIKDDCYYCGNSGLIETVKIVEIDKDPRTLWSLEQAKPDANYYSAVSGRCECDYGSKFKSSYPAIERSHIPPFLKEGIDARQSANNIADNYVVRLNKRVNEIRSK